jgi:hypothetical protein
MIEEAGKMKDSITLQAIQRDEMSIKESRARRVERVKQAVKRNGRLGRYIYAGLSTADIACYNRALMFGESGEAFDADFLRAVTE